MISLRKLEQIVDRSVQRLDDPLTDPGLAADIETVLHLSTGLLARHLDESSWEADGASRIAWQRLEAARAHLDELNDRRGARIGDLNRVLLLEAAHDTAWILAALALESQA